MFFFQWLIINNRLKFDFNLRDPIDQWKMCKLSVKMGLYLSSFYRLCFCKREFHAKLVQFFFFFCIIALVSFAMWRSHSLTIGHLSRFYSMWTKFQMHYFPRVVRIWLAFNNRWRSFNLVTVCFFVCLR